MGRLIDEGELIKVLKERATNDALCGYMTAYDVTNSIIDEVNEQPTAYDPDRIVEQLEELKSLVPVNRILEDIVNEKPKELGMLIAYRKAIEIVKGGGVDAKTDS